MGKKDKKKNKNKMSGPVKTALKTEKKLNAKQKKELAAIGEDDIEKIVAEIEKEEARRQCIKEVVVDTPLRRVNFTLTAHPFKDELIMLGGEFHDGRQTIVYGDMFIYNINKREWTLVKAPGAPPPRCGHQAVATANHGGELWVFGGEFTSPSESQFYHYRDLWVFRLVDKKWEKITALNGPSARSGHRMVHVKKQLIVFGGFHDNLRHDCKYFNDVHIFDLETYMWRKIEPAGVAPTPRSGCILLPTPDNKVLLYGGYSKEKVKKNIELGCIHDDMFLLTQADKNDVTKYKWVSVKQTGIRISPRCGATATLIQPAANQAFVFGGVYDDDGDDEEEDLCGTFYNDLFVLDLEKLHWRVVTLTGKRETTLTGGTEKRRRRRRNQREESCEEAEQSNDSDEEVIEDLSNSVQSTVIVDDDGIFTVTIGSTEPSTSSSSSLQPISTVTSDKETKFLPLPRMNAGMATKHNILYLYGGIMEEGDRQYTFSDFYSLDCRRLDEWKTLIADDLSSQTWFDSSESSEDNENEDDSEKEESDDNKSVNINVEN
ncbi:kelch domain-containing protein 4 isoform X1 [Temnothorax curvispinosus]|uniref:Kelch domain-containing protein 4 isoform X1 n=2 Tax=Temnothorax curvispinosus TaxID=300111 RepID=A0A6J1QWS4_9HYME|nr:kelch domain-containing protein 4 isoform X1 [Temnothorax curvispinosus]